MLIKLDKEKDKLTIMGEGELVITRLTDSHNAGITMQCDGAQAHVSYMHLVNARGNTRIGRFLYVIKHVWRVCK